VAAAEALTPAVPSCGRLVCVDRKKWDVEQQKGTRSESKVIVLSADQLSREQCVYLYRCEFALVKVEGKVNTIQVVECKHVDVAFTDVIATVEVTNSSGVQLQAGGALPSVFLDKVHDVMLYLSPAAMDAVITTCACTGVNVTMPPKIPGTDPIETPLPEQFRTKVINRKLVTQATEHTA